MAKSLAVFPAHFFATPLPLHPRHGRQGFSLSRPQRAGARVRMSLGEFPPPNGFESLFHLEGISARMEGLLFTLADAVVAADPTTSETAASAAAQKNGGWFGFISDAMEVVLKVVCRFYFLFVLFFERRNWIQLEPSFEGERFFGG